MFHNFLQANLCEGSGAICEMAGRSRRGGVSLRLMIFEFYTSSVFCISYLFLWVINSISSQILKTICVPVRWHNQTNMVVIYYFNNHHHFVLFFLLNAYADSIPHSVCMHVFCFLYLFQVLVWQLVRFKPGRLNWFLLSVADCHLKLIVCLFMLAYSKCFINFHTRFVICMKLQLNVTMSKAQKSHWIWCQKSWLSPFEG